MIAPIFFLLKLKHAKAPQGDGNIACILKATKVKVGKYITHAMPFFFHSSEVGSKCNSNNTGSL